MHTYFFHGLQSSPQSPKAQFLRNTSPDLVVPDFSKLPQDLEAWVAHARESVTEPGFIVGSSFGGLTALVLADRFPDLVLGYVLCAPALHWPHHPVRCVPNYNYLIRGTQDDIVPYACCAEFAVKFRVPFQEVSDDHRLGKPESLILIAEMLAQIRWEYTRDARWAKRPHHQSHRTE